MQQEVHINMYSVTAEYVSLAFHSFIKIGKCLWIFSICIILFVLEMKEKKERNSTPTYSNKHQINDCLKYFPKGINYK